MTEVTVGGEDRPRLDQVTLLAEAGEIVAVLGGNGSGKSTLVRAVCGLDRVAAGSIVLGSTDITDQPIHARARLGLATVTEERFIFEAMTVGENLLVAGARRRLLSPWLSAWFPELAPMVDRRAGLLSGGEQALLALARATVSAPRVLLVDEISAGLGPPYRRAVSTALRKAATESGTAVVLAEQQLTPVDAADRVYVLSGGRLTFEGSAAIPDP